ncbi:MAG: hypothetical protein HFJ59_01435 [Clostridia bacterium]|nr:hypothetical protein [Clostridia bacterium]
MKRFTLIMVLLISIMLLAGCGNSNLEAEKNHLQSEIDTLQAEVDTLEKIRDGLIQEDDIVYVIELQISQSHYTVDLNEHMKDLLNKITIPIQVSKEYYFSVKEGEILKNEFRVGSLIFKNSSGSWDIKVTSKEIVNKVAK